MLPVLLCASMRTRILSVALFVALITGSCAEKMESISQITKFRVMGVQAEPPEIAPGTGTTLSVLYSDPKGAGREVTIAWITCIDAFSPTDDISEGCEPVWLPKIETSANGGDKYEIPLTPYNIIENVKEGEFKPVTAIVVLCAGGQLPDFDSKSLSGEINSLDELCIGGDGLVAVKTFRISNSEDRNTNPIIDTLRFNVEADAGVPNGEASDGGAPDGGGLNKNDPVFKCEDSYGCRDSAGIEASLTEAGFQEDEDPYISWFVTGGSFSNDRSRAPEDTPFGPFKVDWTPPRNGGKYRLWAVAHDLRGGTSWKTQIIEAKVPSE